MFWSMRTSNAQSPRFALSLSFEGIGLEEYAKGASSKIAEAILDKDDFDQRISELSRKAEAMLGDGLRVALILPNEQIKFVSVACPDDADPITINEHIQRTMDGATPYPMDELRFDHHLADGILYVAAVALETLKESEEFAKNYGFSPLACIARTDTDTFPTEVFFGLSDAPLGLMPRLSTEEPEEDVEESAPPVIAFARLDTPEDTTNIASTAPLPVEARLSLSPEPVSPTAKSIAATIEAIIAKQGELGAKITARIAESNAGQSWRAPAILLLLITLIGGATWAYLRQEPNIAQPEIELLAPEVQQTAGIPDPTPAAPSPTPETEDVPRAPISAMAPPTTDVISPVETESAALHPEGEAELEFADQGTAASSNYADLVLPFLTDPEVIPKDALERIYIASGVWALEPNAPTVPDQVTLGDLYVASIDPSFEQQDAIALGSIQNPFADQIFLSPPSPAPEGTVFVLDDRGLVTPSSQGTLSPDGHHVFAGLPNFRPPERPNLIEEPAHVAIRLTNTGLPINELKPRLPPTAEEEPVIISAAAGIRPRLRPDDLATPAAIAEAIASAQAGARTSSVMPRLRPKDLKIPVQTALTPATRNRPSDETVTRQNSSSFVAAEATLKDAINLRKINVIGIYGSGSNRRAMVRMTTGRRLMVEVGDSLDGGRVAAISDSELRYVKGGRNVVLKIPKG
jgi:hypothetical protein